MHSETLHTERSSDTFPYSYLLEWEWPEHIEMLLRRLIWARLVELSADTDQNCAAASDSLAAKVCWLMVSSPQTHPAVLDVLASVSSVAFIERVAENPNAAPTTLARLAGHVSPIVRAAVAENKNTPAEILLLLARDLHVDVRYAMAENHQLDIELLQTLSEDENCYVSSRARRTLNRVSPPVLAQMPFQRSQRSKDSLLKVALG